jgi:hypothetical protein
MLWKKQWTSVLWKKQWTDLRVVEEAVDLRAVEEAGPPRGLARGRAPPELVGDRHEAAGTTVVSGESLRGLAPSASGRWRAPPGRVIDACSRRARCYWLPWSAPSSLSSPSVVDQPEPDAVTVFHATALSSLDVRPEQHRRRRRHVHAPGGHASEEPGHDLVHVDVPSVERVRVRVPWHRAR